VYVSKLEELKKVGALLLTASVWDSWYRERGRQWEDWLYEDGENETKGCTSASWRSSRRWVPCY